MVMRWLGIGTFCARGGAGWRYIGCRCGGLGVGECE